MDRPGEERYPTWTSAVRPNLCRVLVVLMSALSWNFLVIWRYCAALDGQKVIILNRTMNTTSLCSSKGHVGILHALQR